MNLHEAIKASAERLTPEQAIAELDAIQAGDGEANHSRADGILLRTVPVEVEEAWQRAHDRDGEWWWA